MPAVTRKSLMPLEEYAVKRNDFRKRVMAHKHNRKLHLGEHVTLLFEDELTIRYQIQEMLRAERVFEEDAIVEELEAYNPLIPDGSNWKATMLIEYPDESERKQALARLIDIEDKVWVQVEGEPKVQTNRARSSSQPTSCSKMKPYGFTPFGGRRENSLDEPGVTQAQTGADSLGHFADLRGSIPLQHAREPGAQLRRGG